MAAAGDHRWRRLSHPRFWLFLAVSVLVTAAMLTGVTPALALIYGFDAGALAFLAATLPLWFDDRPAALRSRALRDDGGRGLMLLVSLAALLAVFGSLFAVASARIETTVAVLAQVLVTLALAWLFVNTIFAHHYGHLYYDQVAHGESPADSGGLAFPGTEMPVFSDFCYFSFVIGMTSQVSDVAIRSNRMRRVATLHGLLAFSFNLGVLAMTINLLAGALN